MQRDYRKEAERRRIEIMLGKHAEIILVVAVLLVLIVSWLAPRL
jgi:hypothetical protein